MRLHGTIFVVGNVNGLPIDDAPFADRLVDQLPGESLGVRVNGAVVVGRVTHAEKVQTGPTQTSVSIDLELDDVDVRTSPVLLELANASLARAENV